MGSQLLQPFGQTLRPFEPAMKRKTPTSKKDEGRTEYVPLLEKTTSVAFWKTLLSNAVDKNSIS